MTGPGINITDVGPKVEAKQYAQAGMPKQVPGEHLWIAMAIYRVRPEAVKHYLDTENLLTIEGPGCYWCELTWRPGMEKTRCSGSPEGQQ